MKKIVIISITGMLLINSLHADFAFDFRRARRRIDAHTIKSATANDNEAIALSIQEQNGDELRYPDFRGSFNKALKHLSTAYPDPAAFKSVVFAMDSQNPSDFDNILIGTGIKKLHSPQSAFAYSLDANDGWIRVIPAAPAFASAQAAGEMVENYWSVLLRDVLFTAFGTNADAISAATNLSSLSDFRGPKVGGAVTAGTLLRGNTAGDLVGNYISQFLLLKVPMGPVLMSQQITPPTTVNFIKTVADYTTVINGGTPPGTIVYGAARYIITPRDLTEYVHKDFPCSGAMNAGLILQSWANSDPTVYDSGNPYLNNKTQQGFVTFGITDLMALVEEASLEAMKAAWYQKWLVNRRARPEEFGFYLNDQVLNGKDLGIHSDLSGNTALLTLILASNVGTYLLSQAYPEGCPPHPAYPAGHASFIGAGVTILKAWFNEDYVIPNQGGTPAVNQTSAAVVPNAAGADLDGYSGTALTIGNELNKLASNISIGRDIAGVHYRSDGWYGMLLGEQIAIDILNNYGYLINENFTGFSLTTFEGKKITVGAKQTVV